MPRISENQEPQRIIQSPVVPPRKKPKLPPASEKTSDQSKILRGQPEPKSPAKPIGSKETVPPAVSAQLKPNSVTISRVSPKMQRKVDHEEQRHGQTESPKVSPRMQRRVEHEQQKYDKRSSTDSLPSISDMSSFEDVPSISETPKDASLSETPRTASLIPARSSALESPKPITIESSKPASIPKLHNILNEIRATEESYAKTLNEMVEFLNHFNKKEKDPNIKYLIALMEAIIKPQKKLIDELQKIPSTNKALTAGELSKLVEQTTNNLKSLKADYLAVHFNYISNYESLVKNIIAKHKSKLEKFAKRFFKNRDAEENDITRKSYYTQQNYGQTKNAISTFLPQIAGTPFQRLPRYELFLKELLENTPESDSNYESLKTFSKNFAAETQHTSQYKDLGHFKEMMAKKTLGFLPLLPSTSAKRFDYIGKNLNLIPSYAGKDHINLIKEAFTVFYSELPSRLSDLNEKYKEKVKKGRYYEALDVLNQMNKLNETAKNQDNIKNAVELNINKKHINIEKFNIYEEKINKKMVDLFKTVHLKNEHLSYREQKYLKNKDEYNADVMKDRIDKNKSFIGYLNAEPYLKRDDVKTEIRNFISKITKK